jgi:hypothetical protein
LPPTAPTKIANGSTNVIERLAAIRRDKIVLGKVEFEKVTTPEPDQQTILDYLKSKCACSHILESKICLSCS